MSQCVVCKEYISTVHHVCKPQWEVIFGPDCNVDYGIIEVRAYDTEEAAEEAAEIYDSDSGEYSIVKNGQETAWVRKLNSQDEWKKVDVFGETVPQYTAYKEQNGI